MVSCPTIKWYPPFSSIILLLLLPHCAQRSFNRRTRISYRQTPPDQRVHYTPLPPPITVWVHGTLFGTTPTYRRQFLTQPRLLPINELKSSVYLRKAPNTLIKEYPTLFPTCGFYLFCWSGKLSVRDREHAAEILHTELQQVCNVYRTRHKVEPLVRIITHSHGGTVALSMARAAEAHQTNLTVNELVLLACPVQERIYPYIKHPMFKQIMSLHSSLDFVQICAPQLMRHQARSFLARINFPPTSKRLFPHQPNLIQAKLKIDGRALTHSEFLGKRFLGKFTAIRNTVLGWLEQTSLINEQGTPNNLLCVYSGQLDIADQIKEVTQDTIAEASMPT